MLLFHTPHNTHLSILCFSSILLQSFIHTGLYFSASGALHFVVFLSKTFFSVQLLLLTPSHLSGVNSYIMSLETSFNYHILISFPLPFIFYPSKYPFVASIEVLAICYFLFFLTNSLYLAQEAETLSNLLTFLSGTLYPKGIPQLFVE